MVNPGMALPEISEVANSFNQAYQQLSNSNNPAVLMPAIHCAAVAMELYLKSLSGKNVDSPSFFDAAVPIIVAAGEHGHNLQLLFDKASQTARDSLENAASKSETILAMADPDRTGPAVANHFREVLGYFNGMFSGSRYPYEANANVNAPLGLISAVLAVFTEVVSQ